MINLFSNISTSFILGLLTPTTAVCVLPLYPAFIAYLSNKISKTPSRKTLLKLGFIISLGVISFMVLLGLVFTTLLQVSLTKVIGIISPIAFAFLFIVSLLLIFNIDIGKFLPKAKSPKTGNFWLNAFLFGFFFGAIVIPCNPLFIAAFFTRALSTVDFIGNMINFLSFGVGIAAPLFLFSIISSSFSQKIITVLVKYKRGINFTAGIIMFPISLYYLIFVFKVFNF
jgi:cytochrome c-type biogenesis protein